MNLSILILILHCCLVFCQEEWKEVTDKASGLKYWWNVKTGATTKLNATNPSLRINIKILI